MAPPGKSPELIPGSLQTLFFSCRTPFHSWQQGRMGLGGAMAGGWMQLQWCPKCGS